MPQYAGLPEDRSNERHEACGCVYLRIGPTAHHGTREIRLTTCRQHFLEFADEYAEES